MLRRSALIATNHLPVVQSSLKGKSTPHGPAWGFNLQDQVDDLGPGDLSLGVFDPQWQSPLVPVANRTAKVLKYCAYQMVHWSNTVLGPSYPKEGLYRLRRIVQFGEHRPRVRDNAFIAPSAVVVGDVVVGRKSTIGYNAVVRGDKGAVRIGESACVNDKVVLHGPVKLGKWTTIDPLSVVDNADVAACSMVGASSVVNPGCRIESGAMLCAASVLKPGTTIPSGEIWSGNPACKLGTLTEVERGYIVKAAKHMVLLNLEHTATWEVTWEDHDNYRLSRESWSTWAEHMVEIRIRPFYSRAGPKDTGRPTKSPLESLQGRMDGCFFESQHIEAGNRGNMFG